MELVDLGEIGCQRRGIVGFPSFYTPVAHRRKRGSHRFQRPQKQKRKLSRSVVPDQAKEGQVCDSKSRADSG